MWQSIGAYLDSLLFVGLGFMAWRFAPTMIGGKRGESQDPKRLALMRKGGIILLIVGIATLLLDLFGA